jgi:DNA invertase Pin-like site-specific DNA recombinase
VFEECGDAELLEAMGDAQRAQRATFARHLLAVGQFTERRMARVDADHELWCVDGWKAIAAEIGAELDISRGRASSQMHYGQALITRFPRPAYERMLADNRDGRVGAVVASDLDRLHRRLVELEAFMALADERHLAHATVSDDVDLSTAQGRLVARLKGSVAAHEIEHKRSRQLGGAQQEAQPGRSGARRSVICPATTARSLTRTPRR